MRCAKLFLCSLLHLAMAAPPPHDHATTLRGVVQSPPHAAEPLHRILQAQADTYFTVTSTDDDSSPVTPSSFQFEIIHPKSENFYWYSVTVVSHGRYTGTADFKGQVGGSGSLIYAWKPLFDGEYEVIVHELPNQLLAEQTTPPLSDPLSLSVKNKPGVKSWSLVAERMATLPPCPTVRRPNLFADWDGHWIGPEIYTPQIGSLRNGWKFLPGPEMNCKIEYFSDHDLASIPEEKSIVVIGKSIDRGIFLSLVDMMLDSPEKEMMEHSVLGRCWGRAVVRKNNLKVTYQDWRAHFFENKSADGVNNVLCHDDKVVREGGSLFFDNGKKVWEEIFRDASSWPDVVLMNVGITNGFVGEGYDLQWFISNLPPRWEGKLFFTDGAFTAMQSGRENVFVRHDYRDRLKAVTETYFDRRVHWLDGMGISKEMRMHAEQGPERITGSQHFHGHCVERYGSEAEKVMTICSNVTELMAQLLLGHALGPKEQFLQSARHSGNEQSVLQYCHACPRDMLPFRITPYPDLTCGTGALHARTDDEVAASGSEKCPGECMDYKIIRNITTQSGIVYERFCPADLFESRRGILDGGMIEAEDANDHFDSILTFSLVAVLVVMFQLIRKQKRQLLNFVYSLGGTKVRDDYTK